MQNKLFNFLTVVMVLSFSLFALVACDDNGCDGTPPHTHEYSTAYSLDDGYHWFECECGAEKDKTAHMINDGKCICGYKKPSEGLAYALVNDDTEYEVKGIGSCTDADIVIPAVYEGKPVTSIGGLAFKNCKSLTSIEIPESVTSIGPGAFDGCEILRYNVKDGLKYLGNESNERYALIKIESKLITSAIIDNDCKVLAAWVFAYCNSLNSVEISSGLKGIGDYAFYECSLLTEVEIPNSVTYIGEFAFAKCSALNSVEIPNGVKAIGIGAFENCNSLTSFEVESENTVYKSINGNLCSKDGKTFIAYTTLGKKETSFAIPNGVTRISSYAFRFCNTLTNVEIPDCVEEIGDYAFVGCSSLTSIEIPNSVTKIGTGSFSSCSSLTSLTYKGTKEEWNSIEKDYSWSSYDIPATEVVCSDGVVSLT